MFKYPKAQKAENKPPEVKPSESNISNEEPVAAVKKDASPEALRELLEKNLKWSQIIYEQTRKINSKLFWKSLWGWMLFIILVLAPTALSIWYLPPIIKNFQSKYQSIFSLLGPSGAQTSAVKGQSSVEEILKLLPVSDQQKAYLKTVLGGAK